MDDLTFEKSITLLCSLHTLESGIIVPVGIIVLVGIFVKINKRTGWNKRTGENYHQAKYAKSNTYFQVSYSNFNFGSIIILHFNQMSIN